MSADIITLQPKKPARDEPESNGSREALILALDEAMLGVAALSAVVKTADFLLGRLAAEGFVIVPLATVLNQK